MTTELVGDLGYEDDDLAVVDDFEPWERDMWLDEDDAYRRSRDV